MKTVFWTRLSVSITMLLAGFSSQLVYSQASNFKLKRVEYISPKSQVKQLMDNPANESLLKLGEKLDVANLKQERKRLINYLQEKGVAVDSSEVQVLVDTTAFKQEYVVYFAVKRPKNSVAPF